MLQVNEEIHFSVRGYHGGGTENPMVRADMIFYKTPNDGGVFAPGSLSWRARPPALSMDIPSPRLLAPTPLLPWRPRTSAMVCRQA